jgi:hypothetical protein
VAPLCRQCVEVIIAQAAQLSLSMDYLPASKMSDGSSGIFPFFGYDQDGKLSHLLFII